MNNQLNPEHEQGILRNLAKAMDIMFDTVYTKPFTCFKCGDPCEDWEGSECETCDEFFCDDCLTDEKSWMDPECCLACEREAAAMAETYRTLRRPD